MKTLQRRIQQAAKEGGVNQIVVELDYAQTYVLLGIANHAALRDTLVFKGGTALKKVHFGSCRFSEGRRFLFCGRSRRVDWARIREILPRKCAHRHVTITSVADLFEPTLLDEVRAAWVRTLGPFVPELPDVEKVFVETRERLETVLAGW